MDLLRSKITSVHKGGTKEMVSGDNPSMSKRAHGLEPINSEGEKLVPRKQYRSSSFTQENNQLVSMKMNMSDSTVKETNEPMRNHTEVKLVPSINNNEFGVQMNQLVLQAALGSCRWPPYLLVLWVVILVLSHVMYCLLSVLTHALPHVKQLSQFLRSLTEECWINKKQTHRKLTTGLLFIATASLYLIYLFLYALYVSLLWFMEPLSNAERPIANKIDVSSKHDVKITSYDEIKG